MKIHMIIYQFWGQNNFIIHNMSRSEIIWERKMKLVMNNFKIIILKIPLTRGEMCKFLPMEFRYMIQIFNG